MRSPSFQVPDNGKLTDGSRQVMANIIAGYAGKRIKITVQEWKEKRSLDQNSLYRGYILPHVRKVMFEAGDARSLEAWHEVLIETFSPIIEYVDMKNIMKHRHLRTHEMDTKQMGEFITAISAEMASRGYPVPVDR